MRVDGAVAAAAEVYDGARLRHAGEREHRPGRSVFLRAPTVEKEAPPFRDGAPILVAIRQSLFAAYVISPSNSGVDR